MKHPYAVTAASIAAALVMLLPASADAQGRRGPRIVRSVRPVVVVGTYPYYRPYYRPFFYDSRLSDPYYRSYQRPYGYGFGYVEASLRLQVTPREAEVFVDGYYAGTVDDFDGVLQRLRLDPGEHTVELYLPGHRSVQQKVYLQSGHTFNIHQTMEPLAPGDPAPVRPVAASAVPPGVAGAAGRTPPRPLPGSARSDFGTLAIRVRPGDAVVMIDGERWDSSPDADRLVVELAPGTHRLEISKDGYRPYSADVTVRPGQTEAVNVALAR